MFKFFREKNKNSLGSWLIDPLLKYYLLLSNYVNLVIFDLIKNKILRILPQNDYTDKAVFSIILITPNDAFFDFFFDSDLLLYKFLVEGGYTNLGVILIQIIICVIFGIVACISCSIIPKIISMYLKKLNGKLPRDIPQRIILIKNKSLRIFVRFIYTNVTIFITMALVYMGVFNTHRLKDILLNEQFVPFSVRIIVFFFMLFLLFITPYIFFYKLRMQAANDIEIKLKMQAANDIEIKVKNNYIFFTGNLFRLLIFIVFRISFTTLFLNYVRLKVCVEPSNITETNVLMLLHQMYNTGNWLSLFYVIILCLFVFSCSKKYIEKSNMEIGKRLMYYGGQEEKNHKVISLIVQISFFSYKHLSKMFYFLRVYYDYLLNKPVEQVTRFDNVMLKYYFTPDRIDPIFYLHHGCFLILLIWQLFFAVVFDPLVFIYLLPFYGIYNQLSGLLKLVLKYNAPPLKPYYKLMYNVVYREQKIVNPKMFVTLTKEQPYILLVEHRFATPYPIYIIGSQTINGLSKYNFEEQIKVFINKVFVKETEE